MARRVGQGGSHTVQSRAAPYTKINYELRYCLVRFLNNKGCVLKHELRVLKRECAQVAITEMSQSNGSLNARSALLMRRNSLISPSCALRETA